jgi:aminoglycoside phosphotransferase (APT) family kinase protein
VPDASQAWHGFDLSAEDARLLRGPVPGEALRWAAAAVGPGARVRGAQALAGGTSSAVHALSVEAVSGTMHELVLRRFVRREWLAEEPDLARREAAALDLVDGARVPTPRLVAADEDGSAAGVPAVLMTRLPGEIVWAPRDVEAFLRGLAELLPPIHATAIAPGAPLPDYRAYPPAMRRAPAWAALPEAWSRAIELLDGPPPAGERLLIHRDFHPGNVLWQDGRISGLVDWVNASAGSPWADVGHCRANLASELGEAASDRLLALYRAAAGRDDDYHPYWDIAALVGGLDDSADAHPSAADERFLAAAVARLAG